MGVDKLCSLLRCAKPLSLGGTFRNKKPEIPWWGDVFSWKSSHFFCRFRQRTLGHVRFQNCWLVVWNQLSTIIHQHSPTIVHNNHNTHNKTNYSPTIIWLVVWNMFYLSRCWEESSQLMKSYFSAGLKPPPSWGVYLISLIPPGYVNSLLLKMAHRNSWFTY
jgi:hypothetical protein